MSYGRFDEQGSVNTERIRRAKRNAARRAEARKARLTVHQRDGYTCQRCGINVPYAGESAIHHRRRKGMGGSKLYDTVPNMIRVCGRDNQSGCHGEVHGIAVADKADGWIIYADDPRPIETIPILTIHGWVLLTPDGFHTPTTAPEAVSDA